MHILVLLLLLVLPGFADEQALAREWAELRHLKGHFQGGSWSEDADSWKGRKHQVLAELGEILGKPGTPETRIRELLGHPDRTEHTCLVQAPADSDVLIYEWRGMHDFLYFVCQEGRVVKSGWWMAGE